VERVVRDPARKLSGNTKPEHGSPEDTPRLGVLGRAYALSRKRTRVTVCSGGVVSSL
jgi:hypothetical protein